MRSNRGPGAFSVVILALIFGVIGGALGAYLFRSQAPEHAAPVVIPTSTGQSDNGIPETTVHVSTEKDAIVKAVRKISPAVVKITGRREPRNWAEMVRSGGMIQGIGSGFIFEYEGRKLVLTNTHVIGDFTDLTLKLTDGRELKAKPLGRRPEEDLAVLEIIDPPDDLVAAPIGNSDKLEQGEWVIALGNPFNFEHTVTVGVVSAMGLRQMGGQASERPRKVIQTDAAINSGNSGGPLVDAAGNVIGINFAIYSPDANRVATTVGIGFAIPINQAKELMYFLVHRGPYIGVVTNPNNPNIARFFKLSTDKGIVVFITDDQGPAQLGGIRAGDVILGVDGNEIVEPEELQEAIFKHKIGETITFNVVRGSKSMDVEVVAGTAPEEIYH